MPYLNNHFHVYDHQSEVSFQIIGKSNFMRWLNDHADNGRYSFFSTYTKLNSYLKNLQEERKIVYNPVSDTYKLYRKENI